MESNQKRIRVSFLLLCLIGWLMVVGLYHTHKKIPENLDYLGGQYQISDTGIEFLYDLTYQNSEGTLIYDQSIFDAMFKAIENARKYILIDMFLFNDFTTQQSQFHRNLSKELSERLIRKKNKDPGIAIDFITDPVNIMYGGAESAELGALEDAGVNVIVSDLRPLRDSNFIYSAIWRTFLQWFGNSTQSGMLPHPFSKSADRVTMRSYLAMMNFKANHRKVFVADNNDEMIVLISSANPHGGSSAHSNVALQLKGEIWRSVYQAEMAVARLSGGALSVFARAPQSIDDAADTTVRIISENQIKRALLEEIAAAGETDSINLAHFYIADRDIIQALLEAAARGVKVKIVLDRNHDAFGYEKNGIPNRPVAGELVGRSGKKIKLRWYDTHGEQFHSKLFVSVRESRVAVIVGSANLTRRNLENFNLELDVKVIAKRESRLSRQVLGYFEKIWTNDGGLYTVDFEPHHEGSSVKKIIYRVQEGLGLGTF